MHEAEMHITACAGGRDDTAVHLEEEIVTLERRIREMGVDGDCAYERAMSKVYIGLVEKRKLQLAELLQVAG